MRILIIKHGALGDVVRTQYFAKPLKNKYGQKLEIDWWTSPESASILRFNPYVDRIHTDFPACNKGKYDIVYSLDDEFDIVSYVAKLTFKKIVGAYLADGNVVYTSSSAQWFDMGLVSRFGKKKADIKKKKNLKTHSEIFRKIFNVSDVTPCFYGNPNYEKEADKLKNGGFFRVGINAFAGKRWPAKALSIGEYEKLLRAILAKGVPGKKNVMIYLFGNGEDFFRNQSIAESLRSEFVKCLDTSSSVLKLAALIKQMDLIISADSLALHLAIAQRIRVVSFFTATSAAEIDVFNRGVKIKSDSEDYCSYNPLADNSRITADLLWSSIDS